MVDLPMAKAKKHQLNQSRKLTIASIPAGKNNNEASTKDIQNLPERRTLSVPGFRVAT